MAVQFLLLSGGGAGVGCVQSYKPKYHNLVFPAATVVVVIWKASCVLQLSFCFFECALMSVFASL
jgi:hypothetical protein